MQWYYEHEGRQEGPVEESVFDELVRTRVVRDNTLVWREGMSGWQTLASAQTPRSATSVDSALASPEAGVSRFCVECGRAFPANELTAMGSALVCSSCKQNSTQRPAGTRRYAGFWIRFAARVIDAILLNIVFFVMRMSFGISTFARIDGDIGGALARAAIGTLLSLIVASFYEIFMLAGYGATLGKIALGLQVVRPDGSGLTLSQATGRYFAQVLSSLTFLIGYIMAAFDPEKRALHDRICDTRVIYTMQARHFG